MILVVALLPLSLAASAQSTEAQSSEQDCSKLPTRAQTEDCARAHSQAHTIELHNVTSQDEANEIVSAVRNTSDPNIKVYLLENQKKLVVSTYPAEFARVEALVRTLDRPHKAYRLAYTITELDGDKTVSTQHMSMVAVIGQRTSVKEGDKIPLATGTTGENNSTQTQFTYIDVGMNFDATIEEQGEGVSLKSKVEQSSVGPTNTIAGVAEPVIRQTVLEGTSILTLNKPVMLGSIDVPTTTRRFDIAVVLEPIK
jgi:type II secretory pathway component GspD/PulD (secretin)